MFLALRQKLRQKLSIFRNSLEVRRSFSHLSGPKQFDLSDDDVVLICVGRNTAFYLPKLFEWHRALGIEKFVYIDNGSSDGSLDVASSQSGTIVASCSSSFKHHQGLIRFYSAQMFARGGWRLVVDADELFDYPGSQNFKIRELLRKLNAQGKTALVAQMLDMIPDGGLSEIQNDTYDTAIASCGYYNISSIEARDYFSQEIVFNWFLKQNSMSNPDIKFHFGGIRKTLFGEECCLSKHPLFKPGPDVLVLPHPHVSAGLNCADFTALLRHYKFTGDFVARERKLLAEGRIAHGETALRMNTIANKPNLRFSQPASLRYSTPEALIDEGFLVMPQAMKALLELN